MFYLCANGQNSSFTTGKKVINSVQPYLSLLKFRITTFKDFDWHVISSCSFMQFVCLKKNHAVISICIVKQIICTDVQFDTKIVVNLCNSQIPSGQTRLVFEVCLLQCLSVWLTITSLIREVFGYTCTNVYVQTKPKCSLSVTNCIHSSAQLCQSIE